MKTYLVTGGAGFIGSNFVLYMLEKYKDITIVNVDKLTYAGNLENLKSIEGDKRHVFVQADICDREAITALFGQYDFDFVINFAAESHVDRSITNPEIFVKTNVEGTVNMLQCAKNAWYRDGKWAEGKKYLQVSTDEVYGSLGETGYFMETTPLDPHSPYSASKTYPADDQQRQNKKRPARVRRRHERARLAVCGGPLQGHRHGGQRRARGRGVQCGRP